MADNDAAPTVTIAAAGSVAEGGTLAFPVRLSHPSAGDVTVSYTLDGTATAVDDYTDGGSGTATFAAGDTERTISLATVDDGGDETDETVEVTLTDADDAAYDLGTPSTATGTIEDNDLPLVTVAASTATVTEGEEAGFVLTRAGVVTEELDVTFAVTGGDAVLSDAPPTAATFGPGLTTVRVPLATADDTTDEPDATLTLTLTNGTTYDLGAASQATVTVEDNDAAPTVTIAAAGSGAEGGTLAFPVRLSHPSVWDVTVSYTLDGTATSVDDYADGGSGTVTFAAGDTERKISLATVDDSIDETDETVEVTLTDADDAAYDLGTPSTATGTIQDNDLPLVTVATSTATVTEGEEAGFVLTRAGVVTEELDVTFAVTGGDSVLSDAPPTAATFGAGLTTVRVPLATADDTTDEPDATLTLTLTDGTTYDVGAASSAEVTVADNDAAPTATIAAAGSVAEGGTLAFPVRLSHPSAWDIAVSYTLDGTATAVHDYTDGGSGTVTFAAGDTERTISLATVDDGADETDETVEVTLTDADDTAYDLGTPSTATGTIQDNDLPLVTVAASTATVMEGEEAGFVLTRAGVVTQELAVTFAVTGGDAVLSDAPPTVATFGAGLTTVRVPLATVDDTTDEPNAALTLTLTDGTTYDLGSASQATVTVADNDAAPTVTIAAAGSVVEGGTLAFPVRLSHPSAGDVTVSYTLDGTATAVDDYTDGGSGTVTFAAGDTEQTISLATVDDGADETDETVEVTLTDADDTAYDLGTPSTATGTIQDNDLPLVTVAASAATVTEGAEAGFVLTRAGVVTQELAVTFAVTGGDAVLSGAPPTAATFGAGLTTVRVPLATVDDTTDEPNAALTLTLTDGTTYDLGSASQATVTVADNDAAPTVTIAAAGSVVEGGTLAFPVRLSHPSAGDVTVSYTLDGTATAVDDYTDGGSGTVTFAAGDTERTISLATVDDGGDETDETVEVTLTDADDAAYDLGTPSTATGTIQDNDLPLVTVAASAATVTEGAEAGFVLTRAGVVTEELAVTFAVTGGGAVLSDAPPTAATFGAGLTTVRLSLATVDDTTDEPDATLTLTLTDGTTYDLGAASSVEVTVADNDAAPTVTIAAAGSVAEGGALAFPVRLSHPSAWDVTVSYTLDGTATAVDDHTDGGSGTVTFAAGDTERTISLATVDDGGDETDETVEVTLTDADDAAYDLGTPSTATGTIQDNDLPLVTVAASAATVTEGAEAGFVLTRAGVVTEELDVTFAVTGGDAVLSGAPPTAATFGADRTTVRVPLATVDDTTDEPNAALKLTLTDGVAYDLGVASTATVTVADNDAAPTVTIAAAGSVAEGGALAFPVRLSHPSAGDVTVSYTLDGTATAVDDYTDGGSGTVTFAAGDTERTISLATVDDGGDETDETVEVTLTDADDAAYDLGTPSTATGTIQDNDLPLVTVAAETATVTEGAQAVFVLTRAGVVSQELEVTFTVAGGDAVLSGAPPTVATFEDDRTTVRVLLETADDTTDEPDAALKITLTDGAAYDLGAASTATVTVEDNDAAPTVTIAAAGSVAEGGTLAFPVRLSHPSAGDIAVSYILDGTATTVDDYTDSGSGTVTFAAGDTERTISLATVDDGADETDETVEVTLTDADDAAYGLGTPSTATGTIQDNDLPLVTVAAETATVTEGEKAGFVLTRAGVVSQELEVTFTVAGGDAVLSGAPPTATTFGVGLTTVEVSLATADNITDEPDVALTLTLTDGAAYDLGVASTATVTVEDDDAAPTVTIADAGSVAEGATLAFPVRLSHPSAWDVTVSYTLDGTATAVDDYTDGGSGTATFAAGDTERTILLATVDDDTDETDETVEVTLTDADDAAWDLGTPSTATGTIQDNDLPLVTVAAETATVTEGAQAVFVLTRAGVVSQELDVTFTVTGGDAVLSDAPPTVATFEARWNQVRLSLATAATFEPGRTTARVPLATADDTTDEPDAALKLTLTDGAAYDLGVASTATVTVEDNDAAPTLTIAAAGSVAEGGTLAFPVHLSHPSAGDVTVSYTLDGTATAGVDYTDGGSGTVTFAAGDTERTISLATVDDDADETDETVEVTLTDADDAAYDLGTPSTATGTIQDNDLPLVTVAAETATMTEGADAVFVLTRAGVVSQELAVTFTVTGGDAVLSGAPPTAATFGADRTTARLSLATADDTTDEPDATLTLILTDGATYDLGAASQAAVTVEDNDAAPTVTIAAAGSVAEGGTLAFPVRLSHPSAGDVTVSYTLDGTAARVDDYTDNGSGTVTFAAGDTERTVLLATVDDGADEADETVAVTLTDGAAYDLGTPSTAAGTIQDNDLPLVTVAAATTRVTEGTQAVFVLTRAGVVSEELAVVFTVTGGDAVLSGAPPTAATFGTDRTTVRVSLATVDDTTDEPDATLTLTLTDGATYNLGAASQAAVTVEDNDAAPRATIADAGSVAEGGTLAFPVRLSHPSAGGRYGELHPGRHGDCGRRLRGRRFGHGYVRGGRHGANGLAGDGGRRRRRGRRDGGGDADRRRGL